MARTKGGRREQQFLLWVGLREGVDDDSASFSTVFLPFPSASCFYRFSAIPTFDPIFVGIDFYLQLTRLRGERVIKTLL